MHRVGFPGPGRPTPTRPRSLPRRSATRRRPRSGRPHPGSCAPGQARPSAVPWLATYGAVTRPVPSSRRAARRSGCRSPDPRRCGQRAGRTRAPRMRRARRAGAARPPRCPGQPRPGRSASTASALGSSTATQPGRCPPRPGPRCRTGRCRAAWRCPGEWLVHRPGAHQRRRGKGQAILVGRTRTRPAARIPGRTAPGRRAARRRPARRGRCRAWDGPANGSSLDGVKIRTW